MVQVDIPRPARPAIRAGLDGPAVPIRVDPIRLPDVEPAYDPAPPAPRPQRPAEVPA